MNAETEQLQHLAAVISGGNHFYELAISRVDDRELDELMEDNLADRRDTLERLGAAGVAPPSGEQDEDLETRLEADRAKMAVVLESNDRYVYMDHLEHLEEKAELVFRDALAEAESPQTIALLRELAPRFENLQERMRMARDAATRREAPKTLATRFIQQPR